jgi:hypothetical protein
MSTLKVDTLQTTGGAGQYTAKAWVNFDGTGTVAIRADGNVSSITDGGTGIYTVNFTTSMSGANYAAVFGAIGFLNHPNAGAAIKDGTTPSTSSVQITTGNNGGASSVGQISDLDIVSVVTTL